MEKLLAAYLPEKSLLIVINWFSEHQFNLKIKNSRSTKLGDFRPPKKTVELPTITINKDLNPEQFLITLTHEFCHLIVWEQHKNKVKPHGKEWKSVFSEHLIFLVNNQIFEEPLATIILRHARNPKASTFADPVLYKHLNKQKNQLLLKDLSTNQSFSFKNRLFIKKETRRTRAICMEIKSNKMYLINLMAEVEIC